MDSDHFELIANLDGAFRSYSSRCAINSSFLKRPTWGTIVTPGSSSWVQGPIDGDSFPSNHPQSAESTVNETGAKRHIDDRFPGHEKCQAAFFVDASSSLLVTSSTLTTRRGPSTIPETASLALNHLRQRENICERHSTWPQRNSPQENLRVI